jgi:hypothetical protein
MKPFSPLPPPHGRLQKAFNYNLQRRGGDISKMFAAACGIKVRFSPIGLECRNESATRVSIRQLRTDIAEGSIEK